MNRITNLRIADDDYQLQTNNDYQTQESFLNEKRSGIFVKETKFLKSTDRFTKYENHDKPFD